MKGFNMMKMSSKLLLLLGLLGTNAAFGALTPRKTATSSRDSLADLRAKSTHPDLFNRDITGIARYILNDQYDNPMETDTSVRDELGRAFSYLSADEQNRIYARAQELAKTWKPRLDKYVEQLKKQYAGTYKKQGFLPYRLSGVDAALETEYPNAKDRDMLFHLDFLGYLLAQRYFDIKAGKHLTMVVTPIDPETITNTATALLRYDLGLSASKSLFMGITKDQERVAYRQGRILADQWRESVDFMASRINQRLANPDKPKLLGSKEDLRSVAPNSNNEEFEAFYAVAEELAKKQRTDEKRSDN